MGKKKVLMTLRICITCRFKGCDDLPNVSIALLFSRECYDSISSFVKHLVSTYFAPENVISTEKYSYATLSLDSFIIPVNESTCIIRDGDKLTLSLYHKPPRDVQQRLYFTISSSNGTNDNFSVSIKLRSKETNDDRRMIDSIWTSLQVNDMIQYSLKGHPSLNKEVDEIAVLEVKKHTGVHTLFLPLIYFIVTNLGEDYSEG